MMSLASTRSPPGPLIYFLPAAEQDLPLVFAGLWKLYVTVDAVEVQKVTQVRCLHLAEWFLNDQRRMTCISS